MSPIKKAILSAFALAVCAACAVAPPVPTPTPAPPTPTPTATPTPLPTPTPVPTATPLPTAQPLSVPGVLPAQPGSTDAGRVLANSSEAMSRLRSFTFDATGQLLVQSENGPVTIPMTYAGAAAAPDRSSGSLIINVYFFALQMDVVIIGNSIWTTNLQSEGWQRLDTGSIALPNPALLMSGGDPALSEPVIVGAEWVDGIETVHLTGVARLDVLSGLGSGRVPADVWIGATDGLVYRIAAQGSVELDRLGLPLADAGLTGEATLSIDIRLSEFNTPVTIEPP